MEYDNPFMLPNTCKAVKSAVNNKICLPYLKQLTFTTKKQNRRNFKNQFF